MYKLTASVVSITTLKSETEILHDDFSMNFFADKNILNKVSVSKRVLNYKKFLPKLTFDEDEDQFILELHSKNPHHKELVSILQFIEAFGNYFFGITQIDWSQAEWEWVAENKKEEEEINVPSANLKNHYNETHKEFSLELVTKLLQKRNDLAYLIIPLSFYREGCNDFNSFRYVNAYMNFYFYLEGLYGGGNTKNSAIEKKFKESKHIKLAVRKMIDHLKKSEYSKHLKQLQIFLKSEQCKLSVNGIIELIIRIRGNVHHFSIRSSKFQGNPLNQEAFESPAYLIMGLCIHTFSIIYDHNEVPQ